MSGSWSAGPGRGQDLSYLPPTTDHSPLISAILPTRNNHRMTILTLLKNQPDLRNKPAGQIKQSRRTARDESAASRSAGFPFPFRKRDFRQTPVRFRIDGLERSIVPILTTKTNIRLLRALCALRGVVR